MSKSVTIRLDDDAYKKFYKRAADEKRSISSLIESMASMIAVEARKDSY